MEAVAQSKESANSEQPEAFSSVAAGLGVFFLPCSSICKNTYLLCALGRHYKNFLFNHLQNIPAECCHFVLCNLIC